MIAVKNAVQFGTSYDLELSIVTAKHRPIRVHTTCRVERRDVKVGEEDVAGQPIAIGVGV